MSLIKTKLLADMKQKEAIEEAKLQLLEYVMFGSLSPVNYDYHQHSKETTSSKKAETKTNDGRNIPSQGGS